MWFDIRDEFGNVLAFFSNSKGTRYARLRVFENSSKVFDDNIGKYILGTLFYGLGRTFSNQSKFTLDIDIGPFGGLGNQSIAGNLYDDEFLCKFRDVQTTNFKFKIPTEYFWNISGQLRDKTFITSLEKMYTSIRNFTGEELDLKPHKVEVNFEWCGVGGSNSVGFGLGVARWPFNIHPGYLGVLSHEVGHMFSFTPPLTYSVECPWFCEPLATYLGIEGIAGIYGNNLRLWYWGTHPGFFDYIHGDTTVNVVERMQFILFYIHETFGADTHKSFFRMWSSPIKDKLIRLGFTKKEVVCILYSYLVKQNLARIFNLAGIDISEERVNYGLSLIKPDLTVTNIATPEQLTLNTTATVSATIANVGNAAAKNFNVTLYVNGTAVDTKTVGLLTAGDSKTVRFSWKPTENKTYELKVTVDPDNVVTESNESNNSMPKTTTPTPEATATPTATPKLTATPALTATPKPWSIPGFEAVLVVAAIIVGIVLRRR